VSHKEVRVLVVDDQPDICALAERVLTAEGYSVVTAHDGLEAIHAADAQFPDLVLMDIRMPKMGGIQALKRISKLHPNTPVVMMSASGEVRPAVEAMKLGAKDYLMVPFDPEELILLVRRALDETRMRKEIGRLQTILQDSGELREMMGYSPQITDVYNQIATVQGTDFTVLIHGESGSGKELVARAVHRGSRRAQGPFVPVDCGSIPESLIESELFGHERGSFTGAYERKKGSFERASGGTLFLDEIGNLPKTMQAKLLRAIQERRIERIGGSGPIDIDIRIIAAGNRRLEDLIAEGRFREDLFHRLNEFQIIIPPLRKRRDDIIYLAKRFMDATAKELNKEVRGISDSGLQMLLDYEWPGNVRELRNTIRRAVLLCDDVILPQHLTALATSAQVPAVPDVRAGDTVPLKELVRNAAREVEQRVIAQVLEKTGGNKSQAARMMGIDYKTILAKVSEYHLDDVAKRRTVSG